MNVNEFIQKLFYHFSTERGNIICELTFNDCLKLSNGNKRLTIYPTASMTPHFTICLINSSGVTKEAVFYLPYLSDIIRDFLK